MATKPATSTAKATKPKATTAQKPAASTAKATKPKATTAKKPAAPQGNVTTPPEWFAKGLWIILMILVVLLVLWLGGKLLQNTFQREVPVVVNQPLSIAAEPQASEPQAPLKGIAVADTTSPLERCQGFSLTFGKTGAFHGEYDSNLNSCVIGLWEDSRVKNTTGISLADLKIQGDEYTILMPFNGYVNHSAREVYVDGVLCTPGNPVQCDGTSLIKKGTPVKFVSEPNNDSSGPMLIEKP